MTHKRAEYRLFPEAIPITRHGAGYSILTCVHSPISHFKALFSAFQGFPGWKHPGRRQKPRNPPKIPEGLRDMRKSGVIGLALDWADTPYKIFFWELSLFFLSCIVTVTYAFLLGELTALPIQRKCS